MADEQMDSALAQWHSAAQDASLRSSDVLLEVMSRQREVEMEVRAEYIGELAKLDADVARLSALYDAEMVEKLKGEWPGPRFEGRKWSGHCGQEPTGRLAEFTRRIIHVDGAETSLKHKRSMSEIARLIGADACDSVSLNHLGRPLQVMLVDDTGMIDGKPVNAKATALYHANCRPGTTHPICGDVAVVFDRDFE